MALTTREDLLADSVSQPGHRVFEVALERIHSEDAPMPPATSQALDDDELETLSAFLAGNLAEGPAHCADEPVAYLRAQPPPDDAEIDTCYRFQAHELRESDDQTPFMTPSGESYACFFFEVPWQGEAQALTIRSLHTPLTHHWLLSDTTHSFEPGESIRNAAHCTLGAEKVLAVYGLNQQPEINMPPGVGLELPTRESKRGLLLGVHYFNPLQAMPDTTGVEVCTAKRPRPATAGVVGLGPLWFALAAGEATEVSSTCTPTAARDVHLISSFPHMHERGVGMDVVIKRADGSSESLLDIDFNFDNQVVYDTPAVLHAGDSLVTTCHFFNDTDRDIFIGDRTSDEMCINFATAWPADGLINGRDLAGAETCLR